MEATSGHLIGFLYLFLQLLRGSLFLTRAHVNRWWTLVLVLEVAVLAHGALVAIMQGEGMWPMFAFGFGGIFVITQMHGLSLAAPGTRPGAGDLLRRGAGGVWPARMEPVERGAAHPTDRLRRGVRPGRHHRRRDRRVAPARSLSAREENAGEPSELP